MGDGGPGLTATLPNGRDQNDNAARAEALGLGRTLAPDAPPATIASAIMDMLGDEALRAADLIERAVRGSTPGIGAKAARVISAGASCP
jgi:UDP:flavonoid glycosyltransferase YjiC (YdhE family)